MTWFKSGWAWLVAAFPAIAKYWKILAVLAVIGVIVLFGVYFSHDQYKRGFEAASLECASKAIKKTAEQQKLAHEASVTYEANRAAQQQEERVRYVQVQKIITKPVYRNVCFDSDGMQIINDSAGYPKPDSGESSDSVPEDSPASGADGS